MRKHLWGSAVFLMALSFIVASCFHQKTNQAPIAAFNFSPSSPKVDEDVVFDASNSKDSDGQIIEYLWNFGDGAEDEGPLVIHSYSAAGRYLVKLTVKDDKNQTSSVEKALQVGQDVAKDFLPAPGPSPVGLAWDGQNLWVADGLDFKIYKISPQNGSVLASIPAPAAEMPDGLAWDGKNLWIVNGMDGKLLQLNPTDGEVLKSLSAPGDFPTGLAWDGNSLWVADADARKIYKVNPLTGKVIDSFNAPGEYPAGLAWDGKHLWHTDTAEGKLYKLDPAGGKVLAESEAPGTDPAGLTWDGQSLWVSDSMEKKLYKINVAGL